ncbi:hypothetical protein AC579_4977 [Pseudocercospora musae]|uniref:Uncharacterized protein n=1 Tax=Pseudocercospora musae TaxID=113226 RepID=A0A139IG00_9PEZI|nr:hypothetical protein AC579_4977 [Pseudocercospora musae]
MSRGGCSKAAPFETVVIHGVAKWWQTDSGEYVKHKRKRHLPFKKQQLFIKSRGQRFPPLSRITFDMLKSIFALLAASATIQAIAFPQQNGQQNGEVEDMVFDDDHEDTRNFNDNTDSRNPAARQNYPSTTMAHYPTSTWKEEKPKTTTLKDYDPPRPTTYHEDDTTCPRNSLVTPGILTVRLHNERRCRSDRRNDGRRVDYDEEVFVDTFLNRNGGRNNGQDNDNFNNSGRRSECIDVDDEINSASFQRFLDSNAFDRCKLNFYSGRNCALNRLVRSVRINDNNERDCLNVGNNGNGRARSLRVDCDN